MSTLGIGIAIGVVIGLLIAALVIRLREPDAPPPPHDDFRDPF